MSRISVVTSCYNVKNYITKAINSVISSTFTDWDYVIVDDGSTNNLTKIILDYVKKELHLRLIQ